MIVTADVETYKREGDVYVPILDATPESFLLGCVTKESGSSKFFRTPQEMWEYILELGRKQHKHDKTLYVYSHNAKYDFHAYANHRS